MQQSTGQWQNMSIPQEAMFQNDLQVNGYTFRWSKNQSQKLFPFALKVEDHGGVPIHLNILQLEAQQCYWLGYGPLIFSRENTLLTPDFLNMKFTSS